MTPVAYIFANFQPLRTSPPKQPTGMMESSPLVRLPLELREQVYALALRQDDDVHLIAMFESTADPPQRERVIMRRKVRTKSTLASPLALTETCKRLRAESTPIVFGSNNFVFHANHLRALWCLEPQSQARMLEQWRAWLGSVTHAARAAIPHIDIVLGEAHRKVVARNSWFYDVGWCTGYVSPAFRDSIIHDVVRTIVFSEIPLERWSLSLDVVAHKRSVIEYIEHPFRPPISRFRVHQFYRIPLHSHQVGIDAIVAEKRDLLDEWWDGNEISQAQRTESLGRLDHYRTVVNEFCEDVFVALDNFVKGSVLESGFKERYEVEHGRLQKIHEHDDLQNIMYMNCEQL